MFTWPYIHTLVNHFPIILMVVGCAVLVAALIWRKRGMWLYAVATLTLAGLSIWPADFSGDQAADALRGVWYIDRATVREHDQAATFALISVLITGVVAAYTWWRMLRKGERRDVIPPVWLRVVTLIIALWAMSVVTRTAYLGGKIIHENPKLAKPPAGVVMPAPDSLAH